MQRGGLRDKISHRAARPCESLPEHLEGLTRLRCRQSHYKTLRARLRKEMQFNRKVPLGAELRDIETGIDQNLRKRGLPEPLAGLPKAESAPIIRLTFCLTNRIPMTTATTTLSSKGQVVIPKEIRDELHWDAGTQIALVSSASGVTLKAVPKKTGRKLADLIGLLKHEGAPLSIDELCKPVDDSENGNVAESRDR